MCFIDAANNAGGAAIYVGVEIPPGVYSSALLTIKSRKWALGDRVKEVIYVSYSMICIILVFQFRKEAAPLCTEKSGYHT